MKILFGLLITLFIIPAHALDLSKYKERVRSHMSDMLGTDTTNKILGPSEKIQQYQMPEIPKIEGNATDASVYTKKGKIFEQGKKFNQLPVEQKRMFWATYIKEIFVVTRQAEAKNDDIATYVSVIEQGGSREGVNLRIVNDEVYRTLEGYPEPAKKELINFVVAYGEKYLAKIYSEEGMAKVNLYTIKKIVVETTLELLDLLAKNPDDLYRWYAIFSEEMATNHSSILTGKVRKIPNAEYHYNWVQKVPFQHIKSEVIIKLHKIMNAINS